MLKFDPNSHDATFARILQRLDNQDHMAGEAKTETVGLLTEIRTEVRKTNGRVTSLERWRAEIKGKTAAYATGCSAVVAFVGWLAEHYLLKK